MDNDLVLKIFGKNLSMGKNLGLMGMLILMKSQIKNILETEK